MPQRYGAHDIEAEVRRYLPMVKRIAAQIGSRLPPHVMLEDLIQDGLAGLMDALQKKTQSGHEHFDAYVSMRVRGAIYDACRQHDILPRHQRDKIDDITHHIQQLEQSLGRVPTESEIAQAAGLTIEAYFDVIEHWVDFASLDDVPESMMPTDPHADPLARLVGQDLMGKVVTILKTLPDKQQLVMALHYQEELSYREIAAVMGLTAGRISQLHSQAVMNIRAQLDAGV